jgi:hypothetical protein
MPAQSTTSHARHESTNAANVEVASCASAAAMPVTRVEQQSGLSTATQSLACVQAAANEGACVQSWMYDDRHCPTSQRTVGCAPSTKGTEPSSARSGRLAAQGGGGAHDR